MMAQREKILVIKLGALGDFVQASGPFAAIRAHHTGAHITLLTTEPFADFAGRSPWFDDVWIDRRSKLWQVVGWMNLRDRLRGSEFARVYDLQTSTRSSNYHRLWFPAVTPEWSGIAPGCTIPHANPRRDFMHTIERQAEQLRIAGIDTIPVPEFSWAAAADLEALDLPEDYSILAPGGAAHRTGKRWPLDRFAAVAGHLAAAGNLPVIIGNKGERAMAAAITGAEPAARDLTGRTAINQLFALARGAKFALGNDTGPMHVAAVMGCPTLVLYSEASDPALCAQRGERVTILRRTSLEDLSVTDVIAVLQRRRYPLFT